MTDLSPMPPEPAQTAAPAIPPPVPPPEELASSQAPAAPAPPPKPKPARKRSTPKWESEARDRLRRAVRKFTPHIKGLIERDANEGDTRLLVTDFLCSALGYDRYADLTTEYQIKGQFADYGVRIDHDLVAFIEVKRCTTKLNEKHLRQVQLYAANEGVEWLLLTNGRHWQAWHLTSTLPMTVDLALDVDLLDGGKPAGKIAELFYLTHESMRRRQIDDLWQQKRVTAPESLAKVLVSDRMVSELRKELRRQTGYNADEAELRATLRSQVIDQDLELGGG